MSDDLLTPDEDVRAIVRNNDIAIIRSDNDSTTRHYYMWGMGGATLTQKHIDALLAGYTLTFAVEEYQAFVSFEKDKP